MVKSFPIFEWLFSVALHQSVKYHLKRWRVNWNRQNLELWVNECLIISVILNSVASSGIYECSCVLIEHLLLSLYFYFSGDFNRQLFHAATQNGFSFNFCFKMVIFSTLTPKWELL